MAIYSVKRPEVNLMYLSTLRQITLLSIITGLDASPKLVNIVFRAYTRNKHAVADLTKIKSMITCFKPIISVKKIIHDLGYFIPHKPIVINQYLT